MSIKYNYMYCVVCGGPAGYDHKCPVKKINRIEAARKGWEGHREIPVNYGTRLQDGFALLEDDGDYDY